MATALQEYNQNYYNERKVKILNGRRKRYRNDSQFRKRARQSSLDRYKDLRKNVPLKDRMLIEAPDGEAYFTIGKLAKAINKSVHTIRFYHRRRVNPITGKVIHNQVIPNVTRVDGRGWRLYSSYQVRLLKKVFKQFDQGRLKTLNDVAAVLRKNWK